MLTATAFSAAYFALTKFDAFPAFISAVALMATIYNNKKGGYLAAVTGLFAKLWPMLIFPFLWIYNARGNSLLKEGKERAVWFLLVTGGIFGVMLWAGYNKFLGYIDVVFCNTITYLVSYILGATVPFNIVVDVFRALIIIIIASALYWMYRRPESIIRMVKMILISIFVLAFFIQYRSPQYAVWMLPFVTLLVAGDLWGTLVFYWVQLLAFIEFPLAFYVLYINDHYLSGWAHGFFTVLFISYGVLLWRAIRSSETGG
jgi:hypothetical protein